MGKLKKLEKKEDQIRKKQPVHLLHHLKHQDHNK